MASFGETVGKLRRLGFAVDEQAVLAAAAGKLPTMELIAEVMLSDAACDTPLLAPYREGGVRGDMPYINFYLDFGAQGRPAFVPTDLHLLGYGIDWKSPDFRALEETVAAKVIWNI